MVKNFILESHRRPSPLQDEIKIDTSNPDEFAAVDRPSYLDMERHTGQDEAPLAESEVAKKRIVDVCRDVRLHHSHANFLPGCSK